MTPSSSCRVSSPSRAAIGQAGGGAEWKPHPHGPGRWCQAENPAHVALMGQDLSVGCLGSGQGQGGPTMWLGLRTI